MKAKFDDINEQLHREAMTMTDDDLLALARKIEDAVLRRSDDAFPGDQDALCLARQCVRMIERHHAERAEWDAHAGQWKATLDEQRAEVERLTRERDEARQENQYLRDEKAVLDTAIKCAHSDELTAVAMQQNAEHLRDVAEAALSAAQKRIAELEGVVRQVVDEKDGPEPPHALGSEWHDRARAALAGKEDGGSPSPLIRSQQGG